MRECRLADWEYIEPKLVTVFVVKNISTVKNKGRFNH